jgi:threonine aldolase
MAEPTTNPAGWTSAPEGPGRVIDLRSDTVTRPSAGMRRAIAEAEVGDDVFAEDPTVNRLQDRAAALLGKEAALYVPSGSMANQIALMLHCRRGDEVLVGEGAHNYLYEAGGGGALAGVQFALLGGAAGRGTFTAADVEAAFKPESNHSFAPSRLVCIENTHNRGGGAVWPRARQAEVVAAARKLGLALHLDGARLLHAAAVLDATAAELAAPFDTASLCFSKGLGAPVGSVLAGSRPAMDRAHRLRKMLGGGMRQAGVLAAAALYALDHNVDRLLDDHRNARLLGEALGQIPGLAVDLPGVETNIVMVDVNEPLPPAAAFAAALRARGVLCLALGPRRLRLVTHLDVSRADCQRAVELFAATAAEAGAAVPRGR